MHGKIGCAASRAASPSCSTVHLAAACCGGGLQRMEPLPDVQQATLNETHAVVLNNIITQTINPTQHTRDLRTRCLGSRRA